MNHRDELEVFGVGDSSNVALDEHVDALMSVDTGLASADTTLQAAEDTSELDGYNQSLPQLSDLFPDEDSGVNDDPYLDDLIDLGLHSTAESLNPLYADKGFPSEMFLDGEDLSMIENELLQTDDEVEMNSMDSINIETSPLPKPHTPSDAPTSSVHSFRIGSYKSSSDNTSEEESEDQMDDETEMLREKEMISLKAQYDYLSSTVKVLKRRRDIDHDQKLKSESDRKLLKKLVSEQQVYVETFRAMLSFAPVNDVRMALMTPTESYIHLGTDFQARRQQILGIREEKLEYTRQYLEEKARGLETSKPYAYSDVFERFGKVYCVNFVISKYDDVGIQDVVTALYDQVMDETYLVYISSDCRTRYEALDNVQCSFIHQRVLMGTENTQENVPELEANNVFFSQLGSDSVVLAHDYIDVDELYPYEPQTRVRKDHTSGLLLTSHMNDDGTSSVIMKRFTTVKFHINERILSDVAQDQLNKYLLAWKDLATEDLGGDMHYMIPEKTFSSQLLSVVMSDELTQILEDIPLEGEDELLQIEAELEDLIHPRATQEDGLAAQEMGCDNGIGIGMHVENRSMKYQLQVAADTADKNDYLDKELEMSSTLSVFSDEVQDVLEDIWLGLRDSSSVDQLALSNTANAATFAGTTAVNSLVGQDEMNLMDERSPSSPALHSTSPDNSSSSEDEELQDDDIREKEIISLKAQYSHLTSVAKKLKRRREIEHRRLTRSKMEQQTMHNLLLQQKAAIQKVKSMLFDAPVNNFRLTLMLPMESYIHLGTDPTERRQQILAMRDDKIEMTRLFLDERTRDIDVSQPHESCDTFHRFGKEYCLHFSIMKFERANLQEMACAVCDQLTKNDKDIKVSSDCVNDVYIYDEVQYHYLHQRNVTKLQWRKEYVPSTELNSLVFSKAEANSVVIVMDSVDVDDLHPYESKKFIRKDSLHGALLTAHVDERGTPYVLVKRMMLNKLYSDEHNLSDSNRYAWISRIPVYLEKMRDSLIYRMSTGDARLNGATGSGLVASSGYSKRE